MKRLASVFLVLILFVPACSTVPATNNYDESKENIVGEEADTSVSSAELRYDSNLVYTENMNEIVFSEKISENNIFIAADDEWFFFADYSNPEIHNYIKINIQNPAEIVTLSSVPASDFTLAYVWQGDLYINFFATSQDGCCYKVLKLTESLNAEEILKGTSSGYPEMCFSGDHLIILSVSEEGENILNVYNMKTQEMQTVYTCVGVQKDDYTISGSIINGMFWPRIASSENGFCYMVSDMNGRTFDDGITGNDVVYFYSFETRESQMIIDHQHIADYVGGTDAAVFVSDYGTMYNVGKSESLYLKENDAYKKYSLKNGDEDHCGFNGFGELDNNRYIAYCGEDFLVVDATHKTYLEKTYTYSKDQYTDQKKVDYEGVLKGYYYSDKCFYFGIVDNNVYKIYSIQ